MAYADALIEAPETGLGKDASSEDLYRVGLLYATGMGVAVDYVAAHKWFNLSAMKGSRDARVLRQEMAEFMSSNEIRQAQRAAREWKKMAN